MGSSNSKKQTENPSQNLRQLQWNLESLENKTLETEALEEILKWIRFLQTEKCECNNEKVGWQEDEDILDIRKSISEYRNATREKQSYLNSVSEIAGTRLKNNNPGITDLSDKNRSSKLAERFSELYDNEWTDVAEDLRQEYIAKAGRKEDENKIEEHCIKFLYQVVTEIYKWCQKRCEDQLEKMVHILTPDVPKENWDQDVCKRCKDFLKCHMSTTTSLENVKKVIDKEVLKNEDLCKDFKETIKRSHFRIYWHTCAELCWFMNLQDPPVYMDVKAENTDLYRSYTRSGPKYEFSVWPSLLLHDKGPLLYKGIAQFGTDEANLSTV